MLRKTLFTLMLLGITMDYIYAQVEVEIPEQSMEEYDYDTTYIKSFRDELNVRLFGSFKYTSFTLPAYSGSSRITNGIAFRPNGTFNNGIGLTHKGFTLNLGTGLPGINGDGSERGKSKMIDFQMHMYMRKYIIDVYLQRYQGYYHNLDRIGHHHGYTSDPNTKLRQFGLGITRVLNHRKFTFRPANIHDEQQLKSAGSLLYGFDIFYAQVKNDENPILHQGLRWEFPYFVDIQKVHNYNFGPSIGYAYNWVFIPNFFLMASATASVHGSIFQDRTDLDNLQKPTFSIVPGAIGRVGVGYNNNNWAISIYAVHDITSANVLTDDYALATMHTGNYRASLVKRFTPGNRAKKILTPWYWFFK